jgi:hypothetical protein
VNESPETLQKFSIDNIVVAGSLLLKYRSCFCLKVARAEIELIAESLK